MHDRDHESRTRAGALCRAVALFGSGRSTLVFLRRDEGITVAELVLALAISAVIVCAVVSAFINGLRVSSYSGETLANQQDMMVIVTCLQDDILRADPVIPDPANPGGPSDHFDFGVSEVTAVEGSLVYTRSYYRYIRSGGAVVKRPVIYDEDSGQITDTGDDPVWSYGSNVSHLEFEYDTSPSGDVILMVTAAITLGEGTAAYSKTIKVAPRNAR